MKSNRQGVPKHKYWYKQDKVVFTMQQRYCKLLVAGAHGAQHGAHGRTTADATGPLQVLELHLAPQWHETF